MTKLSTIDARHFAEVTTDFVSELLTGHPQREALLAGIQEGRFAIRMDWSAEARTLALGASVDGGERVVIAAIDASGDPAHWPVVFPEWQAAPTTESVH